MTGYQDIDQDLSLDLATLPLFGGALATDLDCHNRARGHRPARASGCDKPYANPVQLLLNLPWSMVAVEGNPGHYAGDTQDGSLRLQVVADEFIRIFPDGYGAPEKSFTVSAWGDKYSGAHWYPFQPLYDQIFPFPPPVLDLTVTRLRLALLSHNAELLREDPDEASIDPVTQAAMCYLRSATKIDGDYFLSLSEAAELTIERLIDAGEDPYLIDPASAELGPLPVSAVLMHDGRALRHFMIRPAIMQFSKSSGRRPTVRSLRACLRELGMTPEHLHNLELLASNLKTDARLVLAEE